MTKTRWSRLRLPIRRSKMSAKVGTKVVDEQEDARGEITFEEIAARAYEIHVSGTGGDQVEDWLRAERELIAEQHADEELGAAPELEQGAYIAA
jgi:hypothetical protein